MPTVSLSRLDRLILGTIAVCLVYLCLRGSADSADAQKKTQSPMPVKVIGGLELSAPTGGLPAEVQNPVQIEAGKNGIPVRVIEPMRP